MKENTGINKMAFDKKQIDIVNLWANKKKERI